MSIISEKLRRVIMTELGLKSFSVNEATTARDIPGWDSLSHVRIMIAVEREFGIRFSIREVMALATIQDLQQLVETKTRS
jgi:acyl carrier protein